MTKKDVENTLLWVWVAGVMAAYVYQFKGFIGPLLNLLGFA